MERIISLSQKEFITGIAQGAHSPNTGLWHKANSIFPFNFRLSQEEVNIYTLMASHSGTALSANITGSLIASANDPGNADTYYMDDDGSIYQNTTSVITSLTSPGRGGLAVYQPRGGTKYLYYWHGNTIIGRYGDLEGSPSATASWVTGLQSTTIRPVHTFFDTVYYGNKDRIGSISDQAGTATNNSNALDFPSDFKVIDITDDGFYLVAGISDVVAAFGVNKVVFWNQLDPSWSREWIIPDDYITHVKNVGGVIYVLGKSILWRCTFNSPPEPIRFIRRAQLGCPDAAMVYNNILLWGDVDGIVQSYGKWAPDAPAAFFKPFDIGTSVGITALTIPISFTGLSVPTLVVGSSDTNKGFSLFGSVTSATGVSAETIYFTPEVSNFIQIKRIDITFAEPMASGDSVNIDVQEDEDTAAQDYGTASFAAQGAVKKKKIFKDLGNMEQFKLIINFNGGSPKIKRIDVYGEYTQDT